MSFGCVLCGGAAAETRTLRDAKDGAPLGIALCTACGLVQLAEPPDDAALARFYAADYRKAFRKAETPKLKHVYRAGRLATARLDRLKPWLRPGMRLLDIGAGGGEFVYLARRRGIEAEGIDPSTGYIDFARAAYGVPLEVRDVGSLDPARRFDAITLFHVLEHLRRPGEVVAQIHALLAEGGILVIEVPDLESRETSPYNTFFKAHVSYFTRLSLALLVEERFEAELLESGRVLFAVFRRRAAPAPVAERAARMAASVALSRRRLAEKGLGEYLRHGGAFHVFRRIAQILEETRGTRGKAPRQILDAFPAA